MAWYNKHILLGDRKCNFLGCFTASREIHINIILHLLSGAATQIENYCHSTI